MNELDALLFAPFREFAFMRRAMVATVALALGSGPIGCLLVLRRMSLVGDAMAHAVLPGAAAGSAARSPSNTPCWEVGRSCAIPSRPAARRRVLAA